MGKSFDSKAFFNLLSAKAQAFLLLPQGHSAISLRVLAAAFPIMYPFLTQV